MPGTIDCVDSICVLPQPVASITQFGNSLQAGPSGMNYQWYELNPNWTMLQGQNNQFLNPQTSGLYAVIITDPDGCTDTAMVDFYPLSIEEFDAMSWEIYPNPNDGSFTLNFNSSTSESIEIQIFNTLGAIVDRRILDLQPGTQQFFISTQNLGAGVYFILVKNEKYSNMKKLVVK